MAASLNVAILKSKIHKYKSSFLKYFFAGGLCALVNWFVFYVFNTKGCMDYLSSGIIAFLVSNSLNFVLCKLIFKSRGIKKRIEFVLVTLASVIALVIDLCTMIIFIDFLNILPLIAKILGTGFAFIFNYVFRQFYIFSRV